MTVRQEAEHEDFDSAAVRLHPIIAGRRSGRVLDPAGRITREQVCALLEAGRWSATWGRRQPVRFIAGLRGDGGPDETFAKLEGLLNKGNQAWASPSCALVLLATRTAADPDEATYAPVDLGLALGQLSLQAVALGFIAHPIAGFDRPAATAAFSIPSEFAPLVVVAVGVDGSGVADADPELLARERAPRKRLPLAEVAFAGMWGKGFAV